MGQGRKAPVISKSKGAKSLPSPSHQPASAATGVPVNETGGPIQRAFRTVRGRVEAQAQAERDAYAHPNANLWMGRRQRCAASLGIMANEIRIRKNRWSNTVIELSSAYETAFTNVSGLLGRAATQNQLFWSIMFGALSAATVGGLAVLVTVQGNRWAKTEAQQLFLSAQLDTIQNAVGTGFSLLPALTANKYESTAIPSPLQLRGELEALLNNLETDMLKWCVTFQESIRQRQLSTFERIDPLVVEQRIAAYLQHQDRNLNSQPFAFAIQKSQLTAELEKLVLGLWTVAFCERQLAKRGWSIRDRLPKAIINRLVTAGFLSNDGHYSDADVLLLADWGPNTARTLRRLVQSIKSFQPLKFG